MSHSLPKKSSYIWCRTSRLSERQRIKYEDGGDPHDSLYITPLCFELDLWPLLTDTRVIDGETLWESDRSTQRIQ